MILEVLKLDGMVRILFLLLVLTSCSAKWHLNKAMKKDPSLLVRDTITVLDTFEVVTNKVKHDTIFKASKDTVILKKDKLTIKHYYHRDSVYLYGECDADTIIKPYEVKVPYEKVVYKEKIKWGWYSFLLFCGVIIWNVLKKHNIM